MCVGKLGLLFLLAAASALCGCVTVEPTRNESAGNTNASNGGARVSNENQASPTPFSSPISSPESVNANATAAGEEAGGKLEAYMREAAADLAPEEREALGRIPEESRRLLALRGYLRAGGGAMSRWAWSRGRIESYEKSEERAAAMLEVEKVRKEFETTNPGYSLRVNTDVRSLDEQLSKWNETESVKRAGEELLARAREEVAKSSYGESASDADARRFESFLRGSTTGPTPTLAVPGLSPHGQSRAFDFQVVRGSQLIAGASASDEAWDKAGWTQKLQEAVRRASAKFAGPLASPREPWHYDYRP
jgi:hypothetical protein